MTGIGSIRIAAVALALAAGARPASANVIIEWDEKAISLLPTSLPGAPAQRWQTLVDVAMFDAVNAIEHRYRAYVDEPSASAGASKEAAAASAAAAVLATIPGADTVAVRSALETYLASLPDGPGKIEGQRLGEAVAARVLAARKADGELTDAYRPQAKPGLYVPAILTVGYTFTKMKPFVLAHPSQFRPGPPPALKSKEWAAAYNETKDLGGKASGKRSPEQTEAARFWLMTGPGAYHPVARQLARAAGLDVVDTARLMALYALAMTDAYIAVFDAKYHYELWRPLTAIRNGDLDENPATERDATWQPIDATPMHPEYPCAHCIASSAAVTVLGAVLKGGDTIPEVALTSSTAPGVTHRYTSLKALADEVARARIWAGFHYRFSTEVGRDMGEKVGRWVVSNAMQPVR